MLSTAELQELRQIEQELRKADRGFAWRLRLLQDVLRCAAPGRQAYLLVLAVLAAALLRLVTATGRLLLTFAEGGMLLRAGDPDGSRRHGVAGLGSRAGAGTQCQPAAVPAAPWRHGPAMSTPGSTDDWVRACRLSALAENEPLRVATGQCPVCLVFTGGAVYATRRVHPPVRSAAGWRGGRRRHRVPAARLPLRPGSRPGALTSGNPAGRRLRRPERRRGRFRARGGDEAQVRACLRAAECAGR